MKKSSILIGLLMSLSIFGLPTASSAPTIEYILDPGLVFIQGNSLQAISSPYFPNPRVYGVGIKQEMDANDLKELIRNENPLLYRIIECESGWNNVCNAQSCGRGMGLAQIIPGTWGHIKTEINIGDDPMNEVDNLKAALWLFNNGGPQHWGYPPGDPRGYINGERWGSWDCWAN